MTKSCKVSKDNSLVLVEKKILICDSFQKPYSPKASLSCSHKSCFICKNISPFLSTSFIHLQEKKKGGERKNYESKNLEKFSGQDKGADYEAQTTMYKINKLQGYIVQHREYTQYFIITTSGV